MKTKIAKTKLFSFEILTIFPKILDSYVNESILGRAQKRGLVKIKTFDLRDFAEDKHRSVDDLPYGGGAGMVLMAEPLLKGVERIVKSSKVSPKKTKVIVFSAKGKPFNQKKAYEWAKKYKRIILISGRYEGIDERVSQILKAEEISVGPYVLTDGDVAAMTIISAVARLLPGVINLKSLEEESHFRSVLESEVKADQGKLEYPHYTRPETVTWKGKKYRVPKVLLSGNHKKISEWRDENSSST